MRFGLAALAGKSPKDGSAGERRRWCGWWGRGLGGFGLVEARRLAGRPLAWRRPGGPRRAPGLLATEACPFRRAWPPAVWEGLEGGASRPTSGTTARFVLGRASPGFVGWCLQNAPFPAGWAVPAETGPGLGLAHQLDAPGGLGCVASAQGISQRACPTPGWIAWHSRTPPGFPWKACTPAVPDWRAWPVPGLAQRRARTAAAAGLLAGW